MSGRGRRAAGVVLAALLAMTTAVATAGTAAAAGGAIYNVGTAKCLTVAGGSVTPTALAVQFGCDTHPSRRWRVVGHVDNTFQLVNDHSGLCLTPRSGALVSLVEQYGCTPHPNRSWRLVDTFGPGAMLQNVWSGLCLSPDAGSGADNAVMVMWHCDNHPARNWYGA